jgi:catechol 2,3-dioxygenase-like lactoylglutathione lyase family enzyme
MQLHPIMYVPDQYAERDFYRMLGFEAHYEGDEFPGFLAVRRGATIIGLQKASDDHPAYSAGLRWQFEAETIDEIDEVIAACVAHGVDHQVFVEEGGAAFRTRCVTVRSPAGVTVWFEGPNEA